MSDFHPIIVYGLLGIVQQFGNADTVWHSQIHQCVNSQLNSQFWGDLGIILSAQEYIGKNNGYGKRVAYALGYQYP